MKKMTLREMKLTKGGLLFEFITILVIIVATVAGVIVGAEIGKNL